MFSSPISITTSIALSLSSLRLAAAAPQDTLGNKDFPDPSITHDPQTGQWYTFATTGNGKNVQAAVIEGTPNSANTLHDNPNPWTYLEIDLLPNPGKWVNATDPLIWAPDIHHIPSTDTFVMYYSGLKSDSPYHCIGVAISPNITGPYVPIGDSPWACPEDGGGAIDASVFSNTADSDVDDTLWVLYKIDGSAKGPGGPCGNGDPPGEPTPIVLQGVDPADGITKLGDPITILDRLPEVDGPLIEAPNLIRAVDGTYVLFYSSHCYNTGDYDIKYATAKRIGGPYSRMGEVMGKGVGTFGFTSPGGATSVGDDLEVRKNEEDQSAVQGGTMVFHAECEAGRCMYMADFELGHGGVVRIVG